ncbi:YihY/virulence factor BrkB family protein [Kitasatospora acidiphila]|uniref:YihY/virulence factor BrkB family protein n=1 Tax=Kitasatospora acidiphila TaxID=2567942 RepID=A0A540W228_9ACTN|nr:YhjD/YihY/BrkB family envelope integrity protein [Kitasatospora acidiphila]TQF03053.1 YihY/virulence factor BrkB family protein [Kitasatospora acidiphila]
MQTSLFSREYVVRTLTFWLRPAFALRVLNRFQRIVGFDRSMALASSGLTALIPLAVLLASFLRHLGGPDVAQRLINRYGLSGGGAEAVRSLFGGGVDAGIDLLSVFFLVLSALGFERAAQRLFEQTWELAPLGVRNTRKGLWWILTLTVYIAVSSSVHAVLGRRPFELAANICLAPLTAVFLIWSGTLLSAGRIERRDLVPFGVVAAVLGTVYSVGASFYLPHLFNSYATRYGPVGAVFAMITFLFGTMFVLVGSSVLGREVQDELERIRQGRRPPDDEVRHQWAVLQDQMKDHWQAARQKTRRRPPQQPPDS